ncbi:MAG: hypothetical protein ACR2PR_12140 [Pseudohongiellaceae bacterium]
MTKNLLTLPFCLALYLGLPAAASAAALDEAALEDPVLAPLLDALTIESIDVAHNLNAREVIRSRLSNPRFGRFPDLPAGTLPTGRELAAWEASWQTGEIGGLVLHKTADTQTDSPDAKPTPATTTDSTDLLNAWLTTDTAGRIFVSFVATDLSVAETIARAAATNGYRPLLLSANTGDIKDTESTTHNTTTNTPQAGEFYATAGQRLAIDTRRARRYRSDITEFNLLGERVGRDSNTVFYDARNRGTNNSRNEPAVFLKETLGDEFNQPTIEEIIVPGGVALGEVAAITIQPAQLIFASGHLQLLDTAQQSWNLPALPLPEQRALFDFVQRSELIHSDAIVDIDGEGRVRISTALRDTDAGYTLMQADTQPFEHIRYLPVSKSVIIDTSVNWFPANGSSGSTTLAFNTAFEVRFLSADNMRIAQTRVALEYEFNSQPSHTEYQDAWGRDTRRLRESQDYTALGDSVSPVAEYAGWAALFRKLHTDDIPFLQGRYEFMKIDQNGRSTPRRY